MYQLYIACVEIPTIISVPTLHARYLSDWIGAFDFKFVSENVLRSLENVSLLRCTLYKPTSIGIGFSKSAVAQWLRDHEAKADGILYINVMCGERTGAAMERPPWSASRSSLNSNEFSSVSFLFFPVSRPLREWRCFPRLARGPIFGGHSRHCLNDQFNRS